MLVKYLPKMDDYGIRFNSFMLNLKLGGHRCEHDATCNLTIGYMLLICTLITIICIGMWGLGKWPIKVISYLFNLENNFQVFEPIQEVRPCQFVVI